MDCLYNSKSFSFSSHFYDNVLGKKISLTRLLNPSGEEMVYNCQRRIRHILWFIFANVLFLLKLNFKQLSRVFCVRDLIKRDVRDVIFLTFIIRYTRARVVYQKINAKNMRASLEMINYVGGLFDIPRQMRFYKLLIRHLSLVIFFPRNKCRVF